MEGEGRLRERRCAAMRGMVRGGYGPELVWAGAGMEPGVPAAREFRKAVRFETGGLPMRPSAVPRRLFPPELAGVVVKVCPSAVPRRLFPPELAGVVVKVCKIVVKLQKTTFLV